MSGQGIGASVLRKEDARFLRGRGRYVADFRFPGLREVAFLRSSVAHGRIRAVHVPVEHKDAVYTAADLVNVKLPKCGGLSTARTLLELAAAHGLGTCVGSMMEGPVGIGAAASLVAAHPTTIVSDLDAAWWLAEPPVSGGCRYEGATVVLPDAPGLGVSIPQRSAAD